MPVSFSESRRPDKLHVIYNTDNVNDKLKCATFYNTTISLYKFKFMKIIKI